MAEESAVNYWEVKLSVASFADTVLTIVPCVEIWSSGIRLHPEGCANILCSAIQTSDHDTRRSRHYRQF